MIENVTCEVQHWSMATCPYNDMVSVNYYTGWGWLFLMLLVGIGSAIITYTIVKKNKGVKK